MEAKRDRWAGMGRGEIGRDEAGVFVGAKARESVWLHVIGCDLLYPPLLQSTYTPNQRPKANQRNEEKSR